MESIVGSLRQLRVEQRITQQEVADTMGVSRITISRMESGKADALLTTTQSYASALGATLLVVPDELLKEVEERVMLFLRQRSAGLLPYLSVAGQVL